MQGFKFESAMKQLVQHFPKEKQKKPTLFHSMRVGSLLWSLGYSEDIQIAGLLHDALEDTSMSEELIETMFGKNVLDIVKANSKDTSIENKKEMLKDIVMRCSQVWDSALIVKAADVYDNFLFYKQQENSHEIARCQFLANLTFQYKNEKLQTEIFDKLKEVVDFENSIIY